MEPRSRRWSRQVWVVGVVTGVAFAAFGTAIEVLFGEIRFGIPVLVGALIEAIFFGGFMAFYVNRVQHESGGAEISRSVGLAIKTGIVPEGADTARWSQALDLRRRQAHFSVRFGPLVFGLFAVLGGWIAITMHSWMWIAVVIFVLLALFVPLASRRELRGIGAVRSQLPTAE